MTEHDCLVIAYKVEQLMKQVARLEDAERSHTQAILGERIDRERVGRLRADIERVSNAQQVTGEKQDIKLQALAEEIDSLNVRSAAWDSVVEGQRKIFWGVVTSAASAAITIIGSMVLWAIKQGMLSG